MSRFVTDTHALYWHLTGDARLSPAARKLFVDADAGLHQMLVPGITLIEMVYLVERGRLDRQMVESILRLLVTVSGSYSVAPLDIATARALQNIPRAAVPDMPDRIIAATAYQHGLPLITRDAMIQNAGVVTTIW